MGSRLLGSLRICCESAEVARALFSNGKWRDWRDITKIHLCLLNTTLPDLIGLFVSSLNTLSLDSGRGVCRALCRHPGGPHPHQGMQPVSLSFRSHSSCSLMLPGQLRRAGGYCGHQGHFPQVSQQGLCTQIRHVICADMYQSLIVREHHCHPVREPGLPGRA